MLKERFIECVTDYKDAAERNALAENPDESADYLISLFKAEVDKLTMMTTGDEHIEGHAKAQLQHTKKQLLEGLEG